MAPKELGFHQSSVAPIRGSHFERRQRKLEDKKVLMDNILRNRLAQYLFQQLLKQILG